MLLAVDGNSLLHRSYHALAARGTRSVLGEPIWAIRGLLSQLAYAVERIGPSQIVVGLDDPETSVRRATYPHYKAQRLEKLKSLTSQLALAAEALRGLGVQVVVPPGLEADDVLASATAYARRRGGRTVVVTSDRDAFALIADDTSVLRIINGGVEASPLLTPDRLRLMLGVGPDQYRDFAALRGDPSDNLPGVRGIGPKTAARLLTAYGDAAAVFADVEAGGAGVRDLLGPGVLARLAAPESRPAWALNCEVMAFRYDVDLGLDEDPPAARPQTQPGVLPLAEHAVRRTYARYQLPGTLPLALRTLAYVDTDPVAPVMADHLNWDPTAEWRWRRAYPPLPTPAAPVADPQDQLTLF